MNLIINQNKLSSALRVIERVVSKNVSLPILNTILFKTENGKLKLSATNLELGVNYWIGAKINKDGEIAVPARIISDFVSNIKDEKISITAEKNILTINSENYKTQILEMDTKEFPLIPKIKNAIQFKISPALLREGLINVLDSVSLSETRPELAGIYINVLKNKIEFAATDTFRLSERIINFSDGIEKNFILPKNSAIELIRVIDGVTQDLTVALSENQIFIFSDDFEFISRLVDGRYPEYKRVIPDKFSSLTKVNKNEFERNIRLASIFSSSISDIKIATVNQRMEIKAQNSDRGEINTSLVCLSNNNPFEVSVNYNYLLDGLKVIPAKEILIQYTGDGGPLILRAENNKNQTYVIMPLRH